MVNDIIFPARLSDLIEASNDELHVCSTWEPSELSESEIASKIDEISDIACGGNLSRLQQDHVDDIYSLVSGFDSLSDPLRRQVIECMIDLSSNVVSTMTSVSKKKSSIDFCSNEKNSCFTVIFFLASLISKNNVASETNNSGATKKVKSSKSSKAGSSQFDWSEWYFSSLDILKTFLEIDQTNIWKMGLVQENFLSCIWSSAYKILESTVSSSTAYEKQLRAKCSNVILLSMNYFGDAGLRGCCSLLASTLISGMLQHEHIANAAAMLCCGGNIGELKGIEKTAISLTKEIFHEISHMDMKGKSIKPANIGIFIELFAKSNGQAMVASLPLVMQLMDCPAHQIRSCLLTAFGSVLIHIHHSFMKSQGDQYEAKLSDMKIQKETDDNSDDEDTDSSSEVREEIDQSKDEAKESSDGPFAQNLDQLFRARESLLDILVERAHDVNYYTRADVLRAWAMLSEAGAIPTRRYGSVAELAFDRLKDKTAIVRKQAAALLAHLMDNNPFAGELHSDRFQAMLVEVELTIKARQDEVISQLKETTDEEELPDDIEQLLEHPQVIEDSILQGLKYRRVYCTSALEFINFLTLSSSVITTFVKSKNSSDIIEALRFFKKAVNFSLKDSANYLRSTFFLVWHQDNSIKNECVLSFKDVFLTDGSAQGNSSSLPPQEIASNLIELINRCGSSKVDTESLEKIIGELLINKYVDMSLVTVLGKKLIEYLDILSNISPENENSTNRRVAVDIGNCIRLIGMIAKALPEILSYNKVSLLIDIGLHPKLLSSNDFFPIRETCKCLQYLSSKDKASLHAFVSIPDDILEKLILSLRRVILGTGKRIDDVDTTRAWFSACEEAIYLMYHVHPSPDYLMENIILPMYLAMQSTTNVCSSLMLSRFLFILGQTASCTLIYAEKLASIAKKSGLSTSNAKDIKNTTEKGSKKTSDAPNAEDAMEEEMGLAAALDADFDRYYNDLIENRLVLSNLLGKFSNMIATVVTSNHSSTATSATKAKYSNLLVRETSTLAMCRFMSISNALCEELLPVLFTALERDESPEIRTMMIVSLGDLAFRFPNALEPWTGRIYDRLCDKNLLVRYNTLMVLCHLILHDMVKVKGHVSGIVLCLSDENETIRDLAALFFTKLAERSNNPIYNLLGDIISTLSCSSSDGDASDISSSSEHSSKTSIKNEDGNSSVNRMLTTREFQEAMQLLLSFVKKDKQGDALMERLLMRLSKSDSLLQRRNLAFCASELSLTDKGIKKLLDMIMKVKDALYDPQVFDFIESIVTKARKSSRGLALQKESQGAESSDSPTQIESNDLTSSSASTASTDTKSCLDEIEAFLRNVKLAASGNGSTELVISEVDENIPMNVSKGSKVKATGKTKKTTKKTAVGVKKKQTKSEYDDEEEDLVYSDNEESMAV